MKWSQAEVFRCKPLRRRLSSSVAHTFAGVGVDYLYQFIDIVLHLDQHLATWSAAYGPWIYAILFLIVFCETGLVVTPFLPGDSLLFAAGALAAIGSTDIPFTMLVLFSAAVLGDNLNYWIGRKVGPRVFAWEDSRFFNKQGFEQAHAFFEKHGAKALILARFMPIVRTFMPFIAGVAHMTWIRFLVVSIVGGAIWVVSLTQAGYWLGNIPVVKSNIEFVIIGIIVVSLMPGVVAFVRMKYGKPAA